MDLQQLSERTGIPIRRLRHCIDEALVPDLRIEIAENEVGRRRKFHDDVGFVICCAAKLIEAGIDRSTVRTFMGGLPKITCKNRQDSMLSLLFNRPAGAFAELGDGLNMRMSIQLEIDPEDSGWVHPGNPAPLAETYRPLTVIGLDLGQIRSQVFTA